MTTQAEQEPWITIAEAKRQASEFVLSFLPDEPDVIDCETCRVIKLIAAGLRGEASGTGE
jgi:hypothetical protein